jgi:hypothetical protein
VISFGQMPLDEAEQWPDLIRILREKVKPERDKLRDNADGRDYKARWWQFGKIRVTLHAALAPLERCLVTARTSKHTSFSFQPNGRIFSENLVVFATQEFTAFACLQCRIHTSWVRHTSSTLEDRQGYRPTDCFETFPFPNPDPRTVTPEIESIGHRLYEVRARFMVDTGQGLTKTYNAIKDPACDDPRIVALRRLHEEMDRAVLAAYGWSDIVVPPFCPTSDDDHETIQAFEDEVIDRLYVLNAERAREEQRLGLGGKRARAVSEDAAEADDDAPTEAPKAKKAAARKPPAAGQGKLFSR